MLEVTYVLVLLAAGCFSAAMLHAQEVRATMGGRVIDAQGGVVPSATVLVVSDDTEVKQQTSTNPQGNWIVQFLLPGRYHLSVTAPGFKAMERSGIPLQAGANKP